jgi:tetratricopeptide (TPR) repeat protein
MSDTESNDSIPIAVLDGNRAQECMKWAANLWTQYQNTWDQALLNQVINLQREALECRPTGHPDRDKSCGNLASSLWTLYNRTGDETLLADAIDLHREALRLRPEGHPYRHYSCAYLASSLCTLYNRTGDETLLADAINLHREALRLRPEGHPDRDNSCANLASSLWTLYNRTGDETLLADAIDLHREALRLRPEGHPYRDYSCAYLASSLWTLYNRTGDETLLADAIDLHREALRLRPEGHPDRDHSCAYLASSLRTLYNRTGDETLLADAIGLERETLRLRPEGHPYRDHSCANLASSLYTLYNCTRDETLLADAIGLEREALRLRPEGHPDRDKSCVNLASSLYTLYNCTRDETLLADAIDLYCEGATLSSTHVEWWSTMGLSRIYLVEGTPHYNASLAINYLQQSLQSQPDDPSNAISQALDLLETLWTQGLESDNHVNQALLAVYQRIMTFLPLLSSPVFDLASQLQRLRNARQLGADAFVNAVLAGNWCPGLEHLEIAQGIIWAQRLHQRDPQFSDIPEAQAAELQSCLQVLHLGHSAATLLHDVEWSSRISRDDLYRNSARMYALIHQIRSLPGLERFMLGETYEAMCQVTTDHPAVVLVGARGYFYALIIKSGRICGDGPLKLDLTAENLRFDPVSQEQRSHRGAPMPEIRNADDRGMQITRTSTPLDRYLQVLWLKIVKPVFKVLQLQVCISMSGRIMKDDMIRSHCLHPNDRAYIGALLVHSPRRHSMRQEYTTGHRVREDVAQTT